MDQLELKVCTDCARVLESLDYVGRKPETVLFSVGMVLRDCPTCAKLGQLCIATAARVRGKVPR